MTSTINADKIMNSSGDQDSGVDLLVNDQVKLKTANTDRVTVTDATTTVANALAVTGESTLTGGAKVNTIKHTGGTTAMTIDSTGRILQPAKPSFTVSYNNNSYNWGGTSNGTLVKMAFNSTGGNGHNTGSLWDTSDTRMEAPVAGRYLVGCQWFNNYSSDYARVGAHISINGSTKYQSYIVQWEGPGGNNCAAIVNLAANDYVEFWGSIYDSNATGNSWTGYGGHTESYGYGYLIG